MVWPEFPQSVVPCLPLPPEAMFQTPSLICSSLTWWKWIKHIGEWQLQDICVQNDQQRTDLITIFQSGFLGFNMKGSRCWLPSFFESLTMNLDLLLEVKFSKWDVSVISPGSAGYIENNTFWFCSLYKREWMSAAGDLFSESTPVMSHWGSKTILYLEPELLNSETVLTLT